MGRFPAAKRRYSRALRLLEHAYGAEHPALASLYHNLGGLEHRSSSAPSPARGKVGMGG